MSIRIGHMADTHLRPSQYGNRERGDDFFKALKSAIMACKGKVDVICHCGDLLDSPRPPAKILGQLFEMDRLLVELGIPMLAVTGNHDWSSPSWNEIIGAWRADENLPDSVSGLIPIDGQSVTFKGVRFAGIPQMSPRTFNARIDEVNKLLKGADVALFHGIVEDVVPIFTASDHKILPDMFGNTPVVLLGDLHATGYVRNSFGSLVGYCGSSECAYANEGKDKVVPVISMTGVPDVVEKLPVQTRDFIEMDLETADDVTECIARIRAASSPVIVLRYNRNIEAEMARIRSIVSPDMLLRDYSVTDVKDARTNAMVLASGETRGFQEFVAARLQARADLAELGDRLATVGATDAFSIISKFVEEREKL